MLHSLWCAGTDGSHISRCIAELLHVLCFVRAEPAHRGGGAGRPAAHRPGGSAAAGGGPHQDLLPAAHGPGGGPCAGVLLHMLSAMPRSTKRSCCVHACMHVASENCLPICWGTAGVVMKLMCIACAGGAGRPRLLFVQGQGHESSAGAVQAQDAGLRRDCAPIRLKSARVACILQHARRWQTDQYRC